MGRLWLSAVLLTAFAAGGCIAPKPSIREDDLRDRVLPPQVVSERPSVPEGGVSVARRRGRMTLAEAIDIALRNNHDLRLSAEDVRIAEHDVASARSYFLPQASGFYAYDVRDRQPSAVFGGSTFPTGEKEFQRGELDVQMTIWDFGRTLGGYRRAVFAREVAELTRKRTRQTVIYRVVCAYFDVLRAQKAERVAEQAVEQAEAHLHTARSLYRNGVVDRNDLLRAEVYLAETRQRLISARNAVRIAESAFNSVLGINVNRPVSIADVGRPPEFATTLLDALHEAISERPEFRLVQRIVRMREAELTVRRAGYMPRIYVGTKLSRVDDKFIAHKNSAVAEIGIQMDIFTGGRTTAQMRKAEAEVRKAVETARQVCDRIALQVKQAFLRLEEAGSRLEVARKAVTQADENLRLVESKYRQGAASATDLIDAETARTRAHDNYYTAFYDYIVAVERLRYATGANAMPLVRTEMEEPGP